MWQKSWRRTEENLVPVPWRKSQGRQALSLRQWISANLVLPSLSKLRLGGGEGKGPSPIDKGRKAEWGDAPPCDVSDYKGPKSRLGSGKAEPPRSFRKFWFFSECSHTVSIVRETEDGRDTSCNSCLLNKLFLPLLSGWGALNLCFTPQQSRNISALYIKENRAKENVQSVKGRHYIKTVIKMFLSFDGIIYISLHIHIHICIHTRKIYIHTL